MSFDDDIEQALAFEAEQNEHLHDGSCDKDDTSTSLPQLPNIPICENCSSVKIRKDFHAAFNVNVCWDCSKNKEDYDTISKTDCKGSWLLTEMDLDPSAKGGLGFIERQNPRKGTWTAMKLYLKSQVIERAMEKYGSQDAIDEEIRTRMRAKYARQTGKKVTAKKSNAGKVEKPSTQAEQRKKRLNLLLKSVMDSDSD